VLFRSLDPINFDLGRAVGDVARLLGPKAEEKGIELVVDFDPTCPTRVVGDAGRIRQVMLNLVGNAIKFTETGYVRLCVVLEDMLDVKHAQIMVCVEDTGIGIPEDVQDRLFQSFTQADSSTTRKYGGTGLGLAICKRLIELMGGRIGVESQSGAGAKFWFRLALPIAEELQHLPQADLMGKRVLIVDDLEVNQRILEGLLKHDKMLTVSASDGRRAIELLHSAVAAGTPYDVAILDFVMPEMDGGDLIRLIRADPEPVVANIPALLLSSSGQRGDAQLYSEMGFSGYLSKPVQYDTLRRALSVVLGMGAGQVSADNMVTRHLITESGVIADIASLAGQRILLAEDVPANQKVASLMLRHFGMECDIATNGQEAIDMWARGDYPLLLMDCQMPEMDGYEATRAIREQEQYSGRKHVPIIALTANILPEDRQRCLDAGMDDFLSKPFRSLQLSDMLGRWLAQSPRRQSEGGARQPALAATTAKQRESLAVERIDRLALAETQVTYADDFHDLLAVFLESTPKLFADMGAALDADRINDVICAVHGVKSSVVPFGLARLSAMARQLEEDMRTGPVDNLAARLKVLQAEYALAEQELRRRTQDKADPA
jgi:CheY-like chemotaxis protein